MGVAAARERIGNVIVIVIVIVIVSGDFDMLVGLADIGCLAVMGMLRYRRPAAIFPCTDRTDAGQHHRVNRAVHVPELLPEP
jgi:hypothetical protein